VDSLDDKAAARIDALIERLHIYGNRMDGKFVKKLTDELFELRAKQFDRIFRVLFFYQPWEAGRDHVRLSEENGANAACRDREGRTAQEAVAEILEPIFGFSERKRCAD